MQYEDNMQYFLFPPSLFLFFFLCPVEGNKYANKLCSLTYRTSIDSSDLRLVWLRASDKNAVFRGWSRRSLLGRRSSANCEDDIDIMT